VFCYRGPNALDDADAASGAFPPSPKRQKTKERTENGSSGGEAAAPLSPPPPPLSESEVSVSSAITRLAANVLGAVPAPAARLGYSESVAMLPPALPLSILDPQPSSNLLPPTPGTKASKVDEGQGGEVPVVHTHEQLVQMMSTNTHAEAQAENESDPMEAFLRLIHPNPKTT
jgi:hypothetical protein